MRYSKDNLKEDLKLELRSKLRFWVVGCAVILIVVALGFGKELYSVANFLADNHIFPIATGIGVIILILVWIFDKKKSS